MSKRPNTLLQDVKDHKRAKKCQDLTCVKTPYFNHEGQSKALFCKTHALDEMVNIKSKRCQKCTKQPYFNHKGQTKAMYCKTHALDGMVNVRSKRCQKETCTKHACYNFEGQSGA